MVKVKSLFPLLLIACVLVINILIDLMTKSPIVLNDYIKISISLLIAWIIGSFIYKEEEWATWLEKINSIFLILFNSSNSGTF